jgi:ADP-heptose:LPS heptosyltransferase
MSEYNEIKRILVIQLRAIGDVILTTPVLTVLKNNFPQAEIYFLTTTGIHLLLEDLKVIDEVITYPKIYFNLLKYLTFLKGIFNHSFDLVIDYQGTPGSAIITKISRAKYRLGWKMKRRQWAYNLFSEANRKNEYVPIQKCQALQEIGINQIETLTKINILESDRLFINEYFKEQKINPEELLVNISPIGKRPARQWEPAKFARLVDLLREKYSATVFYSWAPGEKNDILKIADLSKNKPVILPLWSLTRFSTFLSKVDLHISYDNGAKHMALAVGTPTISLFATDFPYLWNPKDDENHQFILADVPCVFCRLRECPIMICMKKIEPEDIIKLIDRMSFPRREKIMKS